MLHLLYIDIESIKLFESSILSLGEDWTDSIILEFDENELFILICWYVIFFALWVYLQLHHEELPPILSCCLEFQQQESTFYLLNLFLQQKYYGVHVFVSLKRAIQESQAHTQIADVLLLNNIILDKNVASSDYKHQTEFLVAKYNQAFFTFCVNYFAIYNQHKHIHLVY